MRDRLSELAAGLTSADPDEAANSLRVVATLLEKAAVEWSDLNRRAELYMMMARHLYTDFTSPGSLIQILVAEPESTCQAIYVPENDEEPTDPFRFMSANLGGAFTTYVGQGLGGLPHSTGKAAILRS